MKTITIVFAVIMALVAPPAPAATVNPGETLLLIPDPPRNAHFESVLGDLQYPLPDWDGARQPKAAGLRLLHGWAFVVYAGFIALALPRQRVPNRRYAAFAAVAKSRMRCTMARNPLERCEDRWSCSPSRPSSPAASTPSTSSTVRSL